jgi:hypothetical protein
VTMASHEALCARDSDLSDNDYQIYLTACVICNYELYQSIMTLRH